MVNAMFFDIVNARRKSFVTPSPLYFRSCIFVFKSMYTMDFQSLLLKKKVAYVPETTMEEESKMRIIIIYWIACVATLFEERLIQISIFLLNEEASGQIIQPNY